MGILKTEFDKFSAMANESKYAAQEYRKMANQLRNSLSVLRSMDEPSMSLGVERINAMITEMLNTAESLEGIGRDLSGTLAMLKKVQDNVKSTAQKLIN